ncbi:MAG: hypothetical protein ACP5JU_01865 [Minisyncoccia bacterium]
MKKIIIFYIIFSFIFLNFRSIAFAQEDNVEEISLKRLECKLPSLKKEIEEATSSYEYINPMEGFSAEGVSEKPSVWDELKNIFINAIKAGISGFISGLLGNVPTVAPQTDNAIGESIKESVKNAVGSIRTAISLSLKDSQYYLQYRIWSEISNKLQSKISEGIIPDLTIYKDLRIFLAYLRIVSSVIDNYESKRGCIDPELKPCMEGLVSDLKRGANELADRDPKLKIWVEKVYDKIEKSANKLYCSNEQSPGISGIIKPTNIAIKPNKVTLQNNKINFYIKDNYIKANIGSINQPVYFSILDKNGKEIQRIYVDPKYGNEANLWNINEISNNLIKEYKENNNLMIKSCISNSCKLNRLNIAFNVVQPTRFSLASIFNPFKKVLSLKNLFSKIPFLAQTYYTGEEEAYPTKEYPIPYVLETEAYMDACSRLSSDIGFDINNKLRKEIEKIDTILASSGGFKEKTKCLTTWEEKDQQLADEGKILGDDPRCKVPGPTLTYPDVYKKIQEQIVSGELDIFKNKEQSTNLMVSFIRSWMDSKLFKIIDKGFNSLEAKFSGESYVSDIANTYNPQRITEICKRVGGATDIKGIEENCKSVLDSQGKMITKALEKEYSTDLSNKTTNILNYIMEASSTIGSYIETLSSNLATINSLNNIPDETKEKITELNDILSNLENDRRDLASTTESLSNISGIEDIFNEYNERIKWIDSSATATEIGELNKKIEKLENEIATTTQELQTKINRLSNIVQKSTKISLAFSQFSPTFEIKIMYEEDGILKEERDKTTDHLNPVYKIGKGNIKKLSFYKYFYPDYIDNLKVNRYYNEKQCVTKVCHLVVCEDYYYPCPDLLVAYDLSRIFNIFWSKPTSGVVEEGFVDAFINHLNNLLQGTATPTPGEYEYLYDEFGKIENIFPKDYDDKFFKAVYPDGQNYTFPIGDAREYLNDFVSEAKNLLELLKDYNLAEKLKELNELKQRRDEYQKWIDEEYQKAWDDLLSGINPKQLDQLYYNLENNRYTIEEIANNSYDKCNKANDLINEIEMEININLQMPKEEIHIEEEGAPPQTKGILKTIFASIKNFIGNIFGIFIKPKEIYLK